MRYSFISLLLLVLLGLGFAGEPGWGGMNLVDVVDDKATVEIALAKKHVPAGLEVGKVVDLFWVSGETSTRRKVVSYSTVLITRGCQVMAMREDDKAKDPEQAVQLTLSVNKADVAKIEAIKMQLVNVVESKDGKAVSKKKPVPLRVEMGK